MNIKVLCDYREGESNKFQATTMRYDAALDLIRWLYYYNLHRNLLKNQKFRRISNDKGII